METALHREACNKLPASYTQFTACSLFLLSEPALIKEFPELFFKQRTEAFSIPLELCS